MHVTDPNGFDMILNGQWCSDKGHWANVQRTLTKDKASPSDFFLRLGIQVGRMLRTPDAALSVLRFNDFRVQISREEPGGPLTIKEIK